MFDSDFKAGKLRCDAWSYFIVPGANCVANSLYFLLPFYCCLDVKFP